MSRTEEANRKFAKTGEYVYNITIKSNQRMSSIADSMKGIENIKIDSKELKPGTYDFIISFGVKDDKSFSEKIGELGKILIEDFPGSYSIVAMQKFRNWPSRTDLLRSNIY
jgi:hypothetical protein